MSGIALYLTIVAYVGSTISGTIGMGGGALLLAFMVIGIDPLVAVPIHAVVQMVSNTTRSWAHRTHIRWRPFAMFALAALPGPIVGLWLLQGLDGETVKAMMGVVILYAVWAPKWGLRSLSERISFALAGALAGTLGVIIGAVGPLIAPFFLRGGFIKEQIIATKAIAQMTIHIIKIAAFVGIYPALLADAPGTFDFATHFPLILPMALATVAGTYTGKYLLRFLSEAAFMMTFRVVLTALALKLILGVL